MDPPVISTEAGPVPDVAQTLFWVVDFIRLFRTDESKLGADPSSKEHAGRGETGR